MNRWDKVFWLVLATELTLVGVTAWYDTTPLMIPSLVMALLGTATVWVAARWAEQAAQDEPTQRRGGDHRG